MFVRLWQHEVLVGPSEFLDRPREGSTDEDWRTEKACPPSDVAEVGLGGLSRAVVLLDEFDRPTGGAGDSVWEPHVAHLRVLTFPGFRRRGVGHLVAASATNDAVDRGLVPQ